MSENKRWQSNKENLINGCCMHTPLVKKTDPEARTTSIYVGANGLENMLIDCLVG